MGGKALRSLERQRINGDSSHWIDFGYTSQRTKTVKYNESSCYCNKTCLEYYSDKK